METRHTIPRLPSRLIAWGLAFNLGGSALMIGGRPTFAQAPRPGMSTRQKVAILAGAAALYYLYHKHQKAKGAGRHGQYYLSKNGRVYYRDAKGNPVWVTPPPKGIQIPASEAQAYSRYQGYNGQTTGSTFGGYGATNTRTAATHPSSPPGPPGPPGR